MDHSGRALTAALAAVIVTTLATADAASQATLVTGTAIELESDLLLAGVEVELLDASGSRVTSAVTDSAGRFRLASRGSGSYNLRATSIGYRTVVTPVLELAAGDTLDVLLRLSVDAVPLAPLEVVARAAPRHLHPGLARFHERVERRLAGRFVLREEIETRAVRSASDLLITAGVTVRGDPYVGGPPTGRGLFMRRTGCAPTVYIDGVKVTYLPKSSPLAPAEAQDAVSLYPPSAIEGIEVYPGGASVPAEFSGSQAGCGVVAIWTRRQ